MKIILRSFIFLAVCWAVFSTWSRWPTNTAYKILDDKELTKMGQYGDSFGALNTLFTGLAFAGVAFSVYYQLLEGRNRDKEKIQDNFESRFFHLSNTLRSHVQAMDITTVKKQNFHGKDCFKGVLQDTIEEINSRKSATSPLAHIITSYNHAYKSHQDDLGPYFRILYHTIRYIDNSGVKDKKHYSDLVRAEFSSGELWALAINGLTNNGIKFRPLIVKYRLLKHLPDSTPIDPTGSVKETYLKLETELLNASIQKNPLRWLKIRVLAKRDRT